MATTPAQAYQAALNYTIDDTSARVENNVAYFKKFLTRMNNSTYMYPTISVLVLTMTNLFIIFSKSIDTMIKLLAIVFLLIYIGFTIYWFKK